MSSTITITRSQLPAGYSTVNFFVFVEGAPEFIAFLEKVFGAEELREARTADASDGLVLHAEVRIGDATIMIADRKPGWVSTPAFPQVYVNDAAEVLRRAEDAGASVVTKVSDFVYGMKIARFRDPWGNLWWLFELPEGAADWENYDGDDSDWSADESGWQSETADYVHRTLLEAMASLR